MEEALSIQNEALEMFKCIENPDDLNIATARSDVAGTLALLGRREEAKVLYLLVLETS